MHHLERLKLIGISMKHSLEDFLQPTAIPKGLEELVISRCEFDSNIPSTLSLLTALTFLDLSDSQLIGTIPTQLGLLSNLQFLSLADNNLSGEIPTELLEMKSLTEIDLDDNSGLSF